MTLKILIIALIVIFVEINDAMEKEKPGTPAIANQDTARTDTAGQAISTAIQSHRQEGIAKVNTGDLCKGNPEHADPTIKDKDNFIPACATCISASAVEGQFCYLNTWTWKTHCKCDSAEYANCQCYKGLNYGGAFAYIVLPFVTIAILIIVQVCMRHRFCPIAKMEAELRKMDKNEAKKKKRRSLNETSGGELVEETTELPALDSGAEDNGMRTTNDVN